MITRAMLLFLTLLVANCTINNSHEVWEQEDAAIFQDLGYSEDSVLWQGGNRELVLFLLPAKTSFERNRTIIALFETGNEKCLKLSSVNHFDIIEDSIYFYEKIWEHVSWQNGGGWFQISKNEVRHFERLDCFSDYQFSMLDSLHRGRILYFSDTSKYASPIIVKGERPKLDDLTMEGFYYITNPGVGYRESYSMLKIKI